MPIYFLFVVMIILVFFVFYKLAFDKTHIKWTSWPSIVTIAVFVIPCYIALASLYCDYHTYKIGKYKIYYSPDKSCQFINVNNNIINITKDLKTIFPDNTIFSVTRWHNYSLGINLERNLISIKTIYKNKKYQAYVNLNN